MASSTPRNKLSDIVSKNPDVKSDENSMKEDTSTKVNTNTEKEAPNESEKVTLNQGDKPTSPKDAEDKENEKEEEKPSSGDNAVDASGPDNLKPPTVVRTEDIEPPVDNTVDNNSEGDDEPFYADGVVALKADKTPAELAAETPAQTEARYGAPANGVATDEDLDNPNTMASRRDLVNQVPSGTHLHPDVAKDLMNRGIQEQHTDNAGVKRTSTEYFSFAPDADHNDKF